MITFLSHMPNWAGTLLFFALPLAVVFTIMSIEDKGANE